MSNPRRILLIEGHPDTSGRHLNHLLVEAYAGGAIAAGHEVRRVAVGELDFPVLRSAHDWKHGGVPPALQASQQVYAKVQGLSLFNYIQ